MQDVARTHSAWLSPDRWLAETIVRFRQIRTCTTRKSVQMRESRATDRFGNAPPLDGAIRRIDEPKVPSYV